MSSFANPSLSAPPVLMISSQPAHHQAVSSGNHSFQIKAPKPQVLSHSSPLVGRKRSRDEAAANLQKDTLSAYQSESLENGVPLHSNHQGEYNSSNPPHKPGTWASEFQTHELAAVPLSSPRPHEAISRPYLRSSKSQRLDQTAFEGDTLRVFQFSTKDANSFTAGSAISGQPVIDDFTRFFGIGWRSIGGDERNQAAARGWARYIENHFDISSVKICCEIKKMHAYLVEAEQGFFLFSEDLRQGRLVSRNSESALQNLKQDPPILEGEQEMTAATQQQVLSRIPTHDSATTQVDTDMVM